MNEKDLEKRLRSVVDGEQPVAPQSLRRFLREMPDAEAEAARRRGFLGVLRGGSGGPGTAGNPLLRRAQLGFGIAAAMVVGLAAGGLILSIHTTVIPAAPSGTPRPTPAVETPRRSQPETIKPIAANVGVAYLQWNGVPVLSNENMALPTQAIPVPGGTGEYLGVTDSPFGLNGLVRSSDGMFWDWSPPSDVNPKAAVLTSIATDGLSTIVLTGAAQGLDGTLDGRIYVSSDGRSWQPIADESIFRGVALRQVVYGGGDFVALGWNQATPGDAVRPVSEWISTDGKAWTRVTTPIKGSPALIVATPGGFVLSGTPLVAGAIDEPPMWHSTDGTTWTRATATDNTAQKMGPLTSATVMARGQVFGVSVAPDMTHELVMSADGGATWTLVKPDDSLAYASTIYEVASLSPSAHDYLFATIEGGTGSMIYMSSDYGKTWTEQMDLQVGGPTGAAMAEIVDGYLAVNKKIVAFGKPGSGLGIWVASLTGGY
jgi:hypothetical protein